MQIIVLLFLCLLLLCAEKALRNSNMPLFSFGKEETLPIRALLAIGIVLRHTSIELFREWGGVIVSVFFFLSGYGLMKSYQQRSIDYLDGFLYKRLSTILVPFLFAVTLWQCYIVIGTRGEYYLEKMGRLIYGDTNIILPTSWFIFAIIIVYLVFYFVARLFRAPNRVETIFVLLMASTIVLTIFMRIRYGFESQWFISTIGIIEGVIVASHEERIKTYLSKHRLTCLMLTLTALLITYGLSLTTPYYHIAVNAVAPLVVYLTVCICGTLKSYILSWIGGISLEIYLVQGMITKLLRMLPIDGFMLVLYSVSLSILFAVLLSRIKIPILSWLNNLHLRSLTSRGHI